MVDSDKNTIRISNLNYAGFPLALGFVIAPILIILVTCLLASGGIKNKDGTTDWLVTIIIGTLFLGASVFMFGYALTQPVLSIILGDQLCFRQVLGERSRPWSDVAAIRLEDERSHLKTKIPGLSIALGTHRILVITFRDCGELRIMVSPAHEERIRAIAAQIGQEHSEIAVPQRRRFHES
jgi:hypothetical protein